MQQICIEIEFGDKCVTLAQSIPNTRVNQFGDWIDGEHI